MQFRYVTASQPVCCSGLICVSGLVTNSSALLYIGQSFDRLTSICYSERQQRLRGRSTDYCRRRFVMKQWDKLVENISFFFYKLLFVETLNSLFLMRIRIILWNVIVKCRLFLGRPEVKQFLQLSFWHSSLRACDAPEFWELEVHSNVGSWHRRLIVCRQKSLVNSSYVLLFIEM